MCIGMVVLSRESYDHSGVLDEFCVADSYSMSIPNHHQILMRKYEEVRLFFGGGGGGGGC